MFMVTIQQSKMYDSIVDGISKAKVTSRPILVSISENIENIDPLIFYSVGKKLALGERFYWREPVNKGIFVGLGAVQTFQSFERSSERFEEIEVAWREYIKECIQTSTTYTNARGPLLFGGFSFDPTKGRTRLWQDFPEAKLILPKYMISIEDNQTVLTTNIMLTATDAAEKVYKNHLRLEQNLLSLVEKGYDFSGSQSFTEHEVEVKQWLDSVETVISHIEEGKLEKAVLARELQLATLSQFDIESILYRLQENQLTSYIFAFESGPSTFIGATPERLIKKKKNRLFSTCLAGSIKRGMTIKEDEYLEKELLNDHKNLAEHQFVVDMIAKELEIVCTSIKKPTKPSVFKAKDIQHLYTPIIGTAKQDVPLLSVLDRLHPTPALGGFPKEESLEEIRNHELLDRGWYAGPIGWMDSNGDGEFAVAIRSGLFQEKKASLFAGCGIVAKSEPQKEYEETQIKFKPMLTAIGGRVNER
jgi:menaquinone-specific isochorismate synthase